MMTPLTFSPAAANLIWKDRNPMFVHRTSIGSRPVNRSLRVLMLVILSVFFSVWGFAQTSGDYRSKASGNWNATSTWETYNGTAWVNATAVPASTTAGAITVLSGHTVTVSANATVDQVVVDAGGILKNSGFILTIANGAGTDLTVNGTFENSGTNTINTSATVSFGAGATYLHKMNGGVIPTASWDATSTCQIDGVTNTAPTAGLDQAFGNFVWNSANTVAVSLTSSTMTGNLNIQNGSTGLLQLWGTTNTTMAISGNLSLSGSANVILVTNNTNRVITVSGNFSFSAGTLNLSDGGGTGTLNVAGNFSHTGGTITETKGGSGAIVFNGTSTQTFTSGGTVSNTINYTANTGSFLQMAQASTVLTGNDFILSSGAGLGITAAAGITTSGATGNIQTTTRTFNAGPNYIYNGSAAQNTGNALTGILTGSLTINNSNGVTLSAAVTHNGTLNLTSGTFATGTNLTLGTVTINRSGGLLTGTPGVTASPAHTINYSGSTKSTGAEFVATSGAIKKLRVDLASGTSVLTLNGSRTVADSIFLSSGIVQTDAHTLTLNGVLNGGSATSYINGTLTRAITSGSATLFPIGTADAYAPVTTTITGTGTLTASVANGNSPNITAASQLNSSKSVKRYWTFASSGIGTAAFTSTFNWLPGDQDAGFDLASARAGKYSGSAWTYLTNSGSGTNSLTVTGTGMVGDFQIAKSCTQTAITTEPVGEAICSGSSLSLSVVAAGLDLTYQWRKDGIPVANATNATFVATEAGSYTVIVNGDCGADTSAAAVVTVRPITNITNEPVGGTICRDSSLSLAVAADGHNVTYQWRNNGMAISGANLASYPATAEGTYTVIVNGTCGADTSAEAIVSYKTATQVTVDPVGGAICATGSLSMSVSAVGQGSLSYQWLKDGVALTGGTSSTFTATQTGSYSVIVTGECGKDTSAAAIVSAKAETSISVQPVGGGFCPGNTIALTVTATGQSPITYQWFLGNDAIAEATQTSYTASTAGVYHVVVTGECGSLTSDNAVVTEKLATRISTQPVGGGKCSGEQISVSALGEGTLHYQWKKDGVDVPGATASSYAVTAAGDYSVVVSGDCGFATSVVVSVTIKTATQINTQPAGGAICPGSSKILSVSAFGAGLTYQWFKESVLIATATSSSFTATEVGSYTAQVTGDCGTVTSAPAVISLKTVTAITRQPVGAAICEGGSQVLSVQAVGENLQYKWRRNGVVLGGGINSSYTATLEGKYSVDVVGDCGDVTSDTVIIRFKAVPTITSEPVGGAICPDSTILLNVSATGEGLTYQWKKNGFVIDGATLPEYGVTAAGSYTVQVGGDCSFDLSSPAMVTMRTGTAITSQPAGGAICPADTKTLSVTAVGENLHYQWYRGTNPIVDATSASYTTNVQGDYKVLVTGDCGIVTSNTVNIRVKTITSITTQPDGGAVCPGSSKILSVVAEGEGLTYQWYESGQLIGGATSSTYAAAAAGTYTVLVKGDCGEVTSDAAVITMRTTTVITTDPIGAEICPGSSHTLMVAAAGEELTYQWYKGTLAIDGATSASYAASETASYYVIVSGGCGKDTSVAVTVRVKTVTSISSQPLSGAVCPGIDWPLAVVAAGEHLTYQWKLDGNDISGATQSNYMASEAGSYTVVVSGDCGADASVAAIVQLVEKTAIIADLRDTAICPGTAATLRVTAVGKNLSYQWKKDGVDLSGATDMMYNATVQGNYSVTVTGDCGVATAAPAFIRLKTITSITHISSDTAICPGTNAILTATAAGEGLVYQWYRDAQLIEGATSASLTTGLSGAYTVAVSGDCGTPVTSNAATVRIKTVTSIRTQPVGGAICQGSNWPMSVVAEGEGLTYQWYLNSEAINGATSSSISATEGGSYAVVVSGDCGSPVTSAVAVVRIKTATSITQQPVDIAICPGTTTTLGVTAAGEGLSYQWRNGGVDISGATSSTYTTGEAGTYSVVVKGDCGTVTSASAIVRIKTVTSITTQPLHGEVCTSTPFTFTVVAAGEELTYQWQHEGLDIIEATNSSYTTAQAGNYSVVVAGACGSPVTSNVAVLRIKTTTAITAQPAGGDICPGASLTLNVTAVGEGLSYQWKKDGIDINGANSTSYAATTRGTYTVVVRGDCGTETSATATVRIKAVTGITTQPTGGSICAGSGLALTVVATGEGLTYQWRKDGSDIAGATSSVYTATEIGNYIVVVSGDCGSVTSTTVSVTQNAATTVTTQPTAKTITYGANTSFATAGTGTGAISYKWQVNTGAGWTDIANSAIYAGATTATLSLTKPGGTYNGYSYRGVVIGTCGESFSNAAVLTVNKVTLTVRADNKTRVYGAVDQFTATINGFITGEALATSDLSGTPGFTSTATITSSPSATPYVITPNIGTLASNNYTFSFANGTLTINKAPLIVKADTIRQTYGAVNTSLLTTTYVGLMNGETRATSDITGNPVLSTTANTSGQTKNAGTYPVTITAGTLASVNYSFTSYVNGEFIIQKAMLDVTALDTSKLYGAAVPVLTTHYTITGFVNGERLSQSTVSGTPEVFSFVTQTSPVANYDIVPTIGTLSATNYGFNFKKGVLRVNKVNLLVNAQDSSRVYGRPDPQFRAVISGFVLGENLATSGVTGQPGFSTNATATSPVGTNYIITPNLGTLAATNYAFTYDTARLSITKAALTAKADRKTRTYGAANPELTITYNGFANSETITSSGITGTPAISTTAVPASNVGKYPITLTAGTQLSGNYTITYSGDTLIVDKAILDVTADNKSKLYGAANPSLSYQVTGFMNGQTLATSGVTGTAVLNTTASANSGAGTYPITVDAGTLAASNYTFRTNNGTLTIGKAVITVTALNKSRVYGTAEPTFEAAYTGFVLGEVLETSDVTGQPALTTNAILSSGVGTYTIFAALGGLTSTNYEFNFVNGSLSVTKAMITVTAEDKTKKYGDLNPDLTPLYTGFALGENFGTSGITGAPNLTTPASVLSGVGPYAINAAIGSLVSANYDFQFVSGILTVEKATLTVTANSKSKTYGSENPGLDFTLNGFKNGEVLATSGVEGDPDISAAVFVSTAAGQYPIQIGSGTLRASNYDFAFVNSVFTVNTAPITVTAQNESRLYGGANPVFVPLYNGFVLGQNLASSGINGSPALTTTANPASPVGLYSISTALGTLKSNNYHFVLVDGTLSVEKANLTVTAVNKTKVYGSANPDLTYTFNGFVNGETIANSGLSGEPVLVTTAIQGSPVAAYPIEISLGGLSSENYTFTFVNGTLNVTKATVTVYADNKTRTYGASNPVFTYGYSGLVNGETFETSGISGTPSLVTTGNGSSPVGTYPILVNGNALSAANYTFQLVDGVLTVEKALLTVTADNKSKTYGAANPSFTYAIAGFVNGQTLATSGVTGAASLSTAATVSSGVGDYDITASTGTLSSANYDFSFVSGRLTITKATVLVTAENKTRRYGSANPVFTAAVTGFVNGDDLFTSGITGAANMSTVATSSSPVGAYPITISQGTLTSVNYNFTFANGSLTVTKAPLDVVADDKSRPYATANPALTYSFVGLVNGETAATSGITGTPSLSTTARTTDNAGTYNIAITAGSLASANYALTYVPGTLTITKAPLTVTASSATRSYGGTNPTFTVTYTGFVNNEKLNTSGVNGTPTITTVATPTSPAGIYDVVPGLGTLTATNYSFVFVNGKLTVNKVNLTVTANNATRAYGAANPAFTATYAGFVNGETFATSGITGEPAYTTPATATSSVGNYTLTPSLGTLVSTNYNFTYANGTLTISQAPITVSADNKSKTYGAANPALTFTYSGFQNGETSATAAGFSGTPTVSTTVTATSNAGTYPITITGNLRATNYSFVYANGVMTVNKAVLNVTADNKSRSYGAANPAFTYTMTGFVNGQTLATSGVTGTPALSTSATASSAAGTYPITPALGTLAAANYSFNYVNGTLTIGKLNLTVTAENKSRAYGAANPAFTATFNGFVNGETLATSGITGNPAFTTTAVANSPAGTTYAITPALGTLLSDNYNFTFANGSLTITKASVNVVADNKQKIYGDANPALTYTLNGFANGETAVNAGITGAPVLTATATTASGVGSYDINITSGTLSASNYTFTPVKGTLSVGKATLTVKADNASRIYGAGNPLFTVSYTGFKNGETYANSGITGDPEVITAATTTSPAGPYDITPALGTLAAANYDFSYVKGVLTVGKAPLQVTPGSFSRAYGEANPVFTATFNGFVNGESLATSDVTGEPLLSTAATTASTVGNYKINGAAGTLISNNYSFSFGEGNLSIVKALLTVRVDDKLKKYGSANPAFTISYQGFVNGDNQQILGLNGEVSYSTTATESSPVGTYPITASVNTLTATNYVFNFVNGTLTVDKATLTVAADNKSKVYGAVNPALTASFRGFVNGENLATSGVTGTPALGTNAAITSGVGDYPITASVGDLAAANYEFSFAIGTLTVGKATVKVIAEDKNRVYGAANPDLTARYEGFVNGETLENSGITGRPALNTTATAGSDAGQYTITAGEGTLTAANYAFELVNGKLTIGKAMLMVKAENKSKVYGSSNPELTVSFDGFVNGDTPQLLTASGSANLNTTASATSGVGTYPITVSAGTLSATNYDFNFVSGTLTVNKATLIVAADNKSKVYGAENPALTASFRGFVNGETLASSGVSGTPALVTIATVTSGAGDYPITASAGNLAAANYDFSFAPGTLTVGKAIVKVIADDKSRVYGSVNPDLTARYEGLVNGETLANSGIAGTPALSTTATAGSPVGSYAITAGEGSLSAANYDFNFTAGQLVIGKATLTVKANNLSKAYGAAVPTLTATISGFVNAETVATSGVTGTALLTTTATENSPIGSYPISVSTGSLSASNYDFSFENGTLAVGKTVVYVTAENKSRTYGEANPAFTAVYNGFVNGETFATSGITGQPSYITEATAGSNAGSYDITPESGTLKSDKYDFVFVKGILTVNKAVVSVIADDYSRAYGESNPQFTVSYSGFGNGEAFETSGVTGEPRISTSATAGTGVGTYPITVDPGTLSARNYNFVFQGGNLTISKALITVTADDLSRKYGAANPELKASYSGFVNGETLASSGVTGEPVLTTTATPASTTGSYEIIISPGTLSAANYDFNVVNGKLAVVKATVTVTAVNATRIYGAENPVFSVEYSGFVNGETRQTSDITGKPEITTLATPSSRVGDYDINVVQGALFSDNYDFVFVKGTLAITKANLNVTAMDASRVYGEENPYFVPFLAKFEGFVNGETFETSGVTGYPELRTTADEFSPVGRYTISAKTGTLSSANYTFIFISGNLDITKATIVVSADNTSRPYGAENPEFSASYSGFRNGQTLLTSDIKGVPVLSSTATAQSAMGVYEIVASIGTLTSSNYSFVFLNGELTIGKARVRVTANTVSKIYGAENPQLTVSYSGFVNGETLASSGLTGQPLLSTTASASSPVGTYEITVAAGTLSSDKYEIDLVNGILTVERASVTITADNKSRVYGTVNPVFTVSYNGFVNGEILTSSGITGAPTLTTTATAASGVGVYDITPDAGTLSSANYKFIFAKGQLAVTKATLIVTALDQQRTYGSANPGLTYTITGFIAGQDLSGSDVVGAPVLNTLADQLSPVGKYDITTSAGTLASGNYSFEFAKGVLNISKAKIMVTANDQSKVYGAANPELTVSYSGFVNGETLSTSKLSGQPQLSTTATASSPAGNYAIEVAAGTLASENYEFGFSPGTLVVGKATIVVKADNQSKVYGAANPVFTASYNGFVNGETLATSGITGAPSFTTSATVASGVGVYDITADAGTLSAANYKFLFEKGQLAVTKATLIVTALDQQRTYGSANPGLTYTITGFISGQDLSGSDVVGAPVLNTVADQLSPVGKYDITTSAGTLASGNYSFEFAKGVLNVTKAKIVVTANDLSKIYGAANPELTVSYSGFVNGETLSTSKVSGQPQLSTTATVSSPAGNYAIEVTAGTLASENYEFGFSAGTLVVGKATIVVKADNLSKVYGAANPVFTASYNGFVNGETLATSGISGAPSFLTAATNLSGTGVYAIELSQGSLAARSYNFIFENGALTITKALLTVMPVNKTKVYGAALPELTYTLNGFVAGQDLASSGVTGAPQLTTNATALSANGVYEITAAIGSLASDNYSFAFAKGILTIGKATLRVIADPVTKVYGETNPALTVSFTGFVNGETLANSGVTGQPELTTTAVAGSPAGTYAIQVTAGSLRSEQYEFEFVGNILTVGKATLTVKADDLSRVYGAVNPVLTASFNGFVNGETLASSGITGTPALTTTAAVLSGVGLYDIVAENGTLESKNYNFIFQNGQLSVTKATLVVTAVNQSRTYGAPNPGLTFIYNGFIGGQDLAGSDVTGAPQLSTSATEMSPVGTYTIAISTGTLASANYSFELAKGTLTVTKARLRVTADPVRKTYGQENPELRVTYTGFVNGENLTTGYVTGQPQLFTPATASSLIGEYDIIVLPGTLNSDKYEFELVNGKLAVGKATLTVRAEPKFKVYGAANPVLTVTYEGFVNGETLSSSGIIGTPVINTSATTFSNAGVYDIELSAGSLYSDSYDFVLEKGRFTINKAVLTLEPLDKSKVYGTENPELTFEYIGFVAGQDLNSSDLTGAPVLSTSATTLSPVGNYDIQIAIGTLASYNYEFAFDKGQLTIEKAVVRVRADDKSRVYGVANPELTATYSGFIAGENLANSGISGTPSLTTLADMKSPAGQYTITASAGTLSAANYSFQFEIASLLVNKAVLTITADHKSRTYGEANPTLTATYNGFMNGEELSTSGITGEVLLSTAATASSPAGTYVIKATPGTLSSGNYEFRMAAGTLTVGKATLTITAEHKSRNYGMANPALTVTYNGFVNGESLASSGITGSIELGTDAVLNSPVGTYPITVRAGSLASNNYVFNFVQGVMTVSKATLTVTVENKSRIYGQVNPTLTYTLTGFMNGETLQASDISGEPLLSTDATVSSAAGIYDIEAGLGTLSSQNYSFKFVGGTLTIGKANLTVTADNKSRIYGAANPVLTVTYNGFVNGETLATSGILGTVNVTTAATAVTPAGTYPIVVTAGTMASANYNLSFVNGNLSIGKATVSIAAEPKSRVYGMPNPELTATYTGFANGETLATSDLSGQLSLTTTATVSSTIGTYPIVAAAGTLSSNNYQFVFTGSTLTLGKAPLTVIADNKSKVYGQPNPPLTMTYMGFMNGETLETSGITGTPRVTTTATASSPVDLYDITIQRGTLAAANYDLSFVNGSMIIRKAVLTVTADNKNRFYGQANPALTATLTGFVNGETLATSGVFGAPVLTTSALANSDIGVYPITPANGTLAAANYSFNMVSGKLTIDAASCASTGLLAVSDVCYGSQINLTFFNTSGSGPFSLVINDSLYTNILSGVPFASGTVAINTPESIWSNKVAVGQPVASNLPIEVGMKFRVNVAGEISGVRFYKHNANTGTHTGSLWSADGRLLATATFAGETASGWQQVNFSEPVVATAGTTYIVSYYAPNGNYAYTAKAFESKRITNATGTLTALKAADGGNGVFKVGGGFPSEVSPDNGNYFVDVVFNNVNNVSRFALTGVVSATGCSSNGFPISAVEAKMSSSFGMTVSQQGLECVDNTTGTISINAYGCNGPFAYSINDGVTYQTNGLFTNLSAGTYNVKVKDGTNNIKDTVVTVGADKAIWTGAVSNDWHNPANWNTLKVPTAKTHVIIPITQNECVISTEDIAVASIQVRAGAVLRVVNNRRTVVTGKCAVLPVE